MSHSYEDVEERLSPLTSTTLEWTAELVEARLVEAFETLRAVGGRVGPKMFGNAMPAIVREDWELWGDEPDDRPLRRAVSKEQFGRMEETLYWPAMLFDAYRKADDTAGRERDFRVAEAVGLWACCIANRRSITAILRARKDRGERLKVASQSSLDRCRREGVAQIRIKLGRTGVLVRPGDSERYRAFKERAERGFSGRRSPKSWQAPPTEADLEQENHASL